MAFQKLTPKELRKHKGISFPGVSTVFFCHDGQGNLLLGKRSQNTRDEQGRWDVGGGGLKHGQSLEQNLRREILEEYGVEAKKVDFLGYMDIFRKNPENLPTHWLAMMYVVLIDPKKVKNNDPESIDEIGWFNPSQLPNPLHSQLERFFEQYDHQLKKLMKKQAQA